MRLPLVFAVTMLLVVTGCSGTSGGSDPTAALSAVHDSFASASSVTITLASEDVPKNSEGVTAAEGVGAFDETEPKFKGTVTGKLQGVAGDFDVIAIGDEMWIKFFTPDYMPLDLAVIDVLNPATLFNPTTGLPSLLEKTTDRATGEQQRDGEDVLDIITGKLSGELVSSLLKLGEPESTFDVTYGITADGELRTAVLTGEFFSGATSTYTFTVKDYGTPVDIERP
ncbi:MAG: LppX_LprAFG lipoprotein [Microbacteriaceae bacterium]|nr:LppX_LprAFG lipoprotein [Microbacteriaceae bacterium]